MRLFDVRRMMSAFVTLQDPVAGNIQQVIKPLDLPDQFPESLLSLSSRPYFYAFVHNLVYYTLLSS